MTKKNKKYTYYTINPDFPNIPNIPNLIMPLFMLCFCIACGIPISNPPTPVTDTFAQKYTEATAITWNLDGNGNYEAKFTLQQKKYRADFTPSGKWLETESNVSLEEVPAVIRIVMDEKYDIKYLEEIELVDDYKKGRYYDVEFKIGMRKIDIEINEAGKIIGGSF